MVAFNFDIVDQVYPADAAPFPRIGTSDSNRLLNEIGTSSRVEQNVLNEQGKALFNSSVRAARENLEAYRRNISKLIELHCSNHDDFLISDITEHSNENLLRRAKECGFFAERTLDEIDNLTHQVKDFEKYKVNESLWTPEAEAFLTRFRETLSVLVWTEEVARRWVLQLLNEFQSRHPENDQIALESVDLGPTNASRLPSVL